MKKPTLIFVVGPTAIGKSSVAVNLACELNGEIISCDSMQIYKEASIVSNKPTLDDMRDIQHHMISIISVEDEYNVVRYYETALTSIDQILSRQKLPIIVGGSGLYMNILLNGIDENGQKDEVLRKQLQQTARLKGARYLHEILQTKDPEAAQKIHVNDVKKVIRALEILQNKPKADENTEKTKTGLWDQFDIKVFALDMNRDTLYEMINQRVDVMFENGIVDEVKSLLEKKLSLTAFAMIGVREIEGFLNGQYTLEQAKNIMKQNTRRYAKRQWTWFRKDKRLEWINIDHLDGVQQISDVIRGKICS